MFFGVVTNYFAEDTSVLSLHGMNGGTGKHLSGVHAFTYLEEGNSAGMPIDRCDIFSPSKHPRGRGNSK